MQIRIINMPQGEAPEEIRRAWIGIELPVDQKNGKPVERGVVGVVTGKNTFFRSLLRWILGKQEIMRGYSVDANTAFALLIMHNADAAAWWREHTPHLFRGRHRLMFDEHACELINE